MAYVFSNQQKASATVWRPNDLTAKFKIAGVNGAQTNANNFYTAITGLLDVVGLSQRHLDRSITQDVEEESP